MKSKEEILNLSPDELNEKLTELQEEMANLKLQQATHQITNPMRIRTVRRHIARIRTLQAEFASGIRTVKKAEKE
jgi:large subunit ribosomal protein L29